VRLTRSRHLLPAALAELLVGASAGCSSPGPAGPRRPARRPQRRPSVRTNVDVPPVYLDVLNQPADVSFVLT
jgi:hypothetical protein